MTEICNYFDINILKETLITQKSEVKNLFTEKKEAKFVAKISSPEIIHKTDCG